MKINANFLIAAISCLVSTFTVFADWEYVETNNVAFKATGYGYLTDSAGIWKITAQRTKNSGKLTVDGRGAVCLSKEATPWNFTNVTDKPESGRDPAEVFVTTFKACQGVNISELIAPDCVSLSVAQSVYPFKECTSLTNVELSVDFEDFDTSAFDGCTSLERFSPSVMDKVIIISGYAFRGCEKLKVDLSFLNCTTVGNSAFARSGIKSVSLPNLAELNTTSGAIFSGCKNLESFVWNFPDYHAAIPYACFEGCSSLARIEIKTPVSEILANVFKDIAPGAEIFLPVEAPETIGALSFVNTTTGPTHRLFLQGNYEAWLEAFKVNHHIIPLGNDAELAAFNAGWSEEALDGKTRNRTDVIYQMERDEDICRIEDINNTPKNSGDDKVTLLKRGLLAYAVRKHSGNASYSYGCWIFKVPREGLKVIMK